MGLEKEKEMREATEPAFWVVRDVSQDSAASKPIKSILSWKDCEKCRFGHIYRYHEQAVLHVRQNHFGESGSIRRIERRISEGTLANWLRNEHQYRTDQRLGLYKTYLELTLGHIVAILEKARYIREGVLNVQSPQTIRYLLPSSLVSSFECAIMLLLYTARSFEAVHRYSNHFEENQESEKKDREGLAQLKGVRNDLEAAGRVAMESMEKAKRDIMLMIFTDVDTAVVSYDAVGPEYILLSVMDNLFDRPLHGTEQVDKVYASFVRKVVSKFIFSSSVIGL
jgi:hypothetical protein